MGKFSTYRYLELKDNSATSHLNGRSRMMVKQPRAMKKMFLLLIVLAFGGIYFLDQELERQYYPQYVKLYDRFLIGGHQWMDGLAKSLGYEGEYHHAVIIDAGSSGTRVLAYKFRVPFTVLFAANLDLVEEYFEQSKPGLSSYVEDPEKGAQTVVDLIKKAEHMTPVEKRRDTPILVRATAGLRLLHAEKAQALIEHVDRAIATLGYQTDRNSVKVMDGYDEGIYIWYTVNLLSDLLGSGSTMAALDLGGGSTQVTFQLAERDRPRYPIIDQFTIAAGTNVTLYTHSYLNLGLLAARDGVLRMEAGAGAGGAAGGDNGSLVLTSACVDPIVREERWQYGGRDLVVSGLPRQGLTRQQVVERCRAHVRAYVTHTLSPPPPARARPPPAPPASPARIAAMSFFYDVAADAGLIDVMVGDTLPVSAYRVAALRECSASNVEQPWACLDLVYILTLLQDTYRMPDNQRISLVKKIKGHEVSWALGLAYTTLMNRNTHQ